MAIADTQFARPEDVGMSSERLAAIDKFYLERVNQGELAGIVLLTARHGKVVHLSGIGYANVATGEPMTIDTLFRWYSMTRPITAVALMRLYEDQRFQLRDPISHYIPELAGLKVLSTPESGFDDALPLTRQPTIEDALRHTAGFGIGVGDDPANRQLATLGIYGRDVSLAEMMKRIAQVPLVYQPGSRWSYSVASDVQARLVEVLSGVPFETFLKERIFTPLGMTSAIYWLTPEQYKRLAAVHRMKNGRLTPWDKEASDAVQEPLTSINTEVGDRKLKSGSFGLIGTAEDYWRFAQMIVNGGELNGARILSPQTVHCMTRDHLGSIDATMLAVLARGTGFGLGFAVTTDGAAAGRMNTEGSVWWNGAATTLWWADPKADLVVVAMTQYIDSSGPNLAVLHPQIRDLVYGALVV